MQVITEPSGTYDLIIITAKAHATAAIARDVVPCLAEEGRLMTLQNGLGNAEVLMQHVPPERVAVGLTSHGVTVEAPGVLHHAGTGMFRIGPAPGDTTRHDDLIELFDHARLAPEAIENTVGHLWMKGGVNAGINALCALHGIKNGGLRAHWAQATELVDEVYSLSRAAGVRLPGDLQAAFEKTVDGTADNKCSMLQDVAARRPTEIDHITGYFVRVARRLGYPLFENEAVYEQVKALEASYLGDGAQATTRAAALAFQWP